MGLRTDISPYIGNLSFLRVLDLRQNNLSGQIPYELSRLSRLGVLILQNNQLKGVIPPSLYFCKKLQVISLYGNKLNGTIPKELGYFPKLRILLLGENAFAPSNPSFLANVSTLQMLGLENFGLAGPLPPFIFNLSSLSELALTGGKLTNTIPLDFCHYLPELQYLDLRSNQLSGPFPVALFQCKELRELLLYSNNLNGSIPNEISALSKLEVLTLDSNKFTGMIPPSLGNISGLAMLLLNDNNIQGNIPKELGLLSNLATVSLANNNITGEIPLQIFNISSLEEFTIAQNDVYGSLPISSGSQLPNLERVIVTGNRLSGNFPSFISNSSKLSILDMASNSFTGPIPLNLGNLNQLRFLLLPGNQLTGGRGSRELTFMNSLTDCKFLKMLVLDSNPLDGILPNSTGNISNSIKWISMNNCQINGPIPREIGLLKNLNYLDLGDNNINGTIPSTFGGLESTQRLYLGNNYIEGSIPREVCRLTNLGELSLQYNKLLGSIPDCIGELGRLQKLYLNSNNFTSLIPKSLFSLQNLLLLNLSSNSLGGSLSADMSMNMIETMDFSWNKISGGIPSKIGQFKGLSYLNLSRNKLEGSIPQLFGDLVSLDSMDLSHNNLSGEIPISLESLLHLKILNLSFNRLSGEIPKGGPFANFTAQSFINNENLCGDAYLDVPPCKIGENSDKRSKTKNRILIYIFASVAGAMMLIFLVHMLRKHHKDNNRNPNSSTLLPTFKRLEYRIISYQELRLATDNFSGTNLIGRGSFASVFKGRLSDGMLVAIKVLNLQKDGAFRSFDAECEVLRSVRHRNLVKVISSCSSEDLRALILEYMANGSLDKWLHTEGCKLSLYQRINIMIDVATALEYIHHGQPEPIVHCDIKPSNILLDEDMSAHVGDFGIAKILLANKDGTETKTLGTIGYIAPEYGSEGKVSTKGDVYSYGIVLLETLTGRRPTAEIFDGGQSLRLWVMESLPNNIMEVVDDCMMGLEGNMKKCLASILEVALECSHELPEQRIDMKEEQDQARAFSQWRCLKCESME